MKLLLIRHARAEERAAFAASGLPDEERPLTRDGIRRMRRACAGLAREVVTLDLIASSPLLRARQTAEIVHAAYPQARRTELGALSPGAHPRAVRDWLRDQEAGAVALVGHEPDLGLLAAWLLSGDAHPFLPMKKGAACLLDLPGAIEEGAATLAWSLQARHLAALRA